MARPSVPVVKTYPARGPLQQFRLARAVPFECFRCGQDKKSKLRSVYLGDWSRTLCNGCYGRLLSIYEIQAGTQPDDVKGEELAKLLMEMVSAADARAALRRSSYARDPTQFLTEDAQRFLGSSECAADALVGQETVEWSLPIVGLAKVVERELLERFLRPLQQNCIPSDLSDDLADPDFGALARWAASAVDKAPALGILQYTLVAMAKSKRRAATSGLIKAVRGQAARWSRGAWLINSDGLPAMLDRLTPYRNPASHIGVMGLNGYRECRELVIGSNGLVWRLIDATQ